MNPSGVRSAAVGATPDVSGGVASSEVQLTLPLASDCREGPSAEALTHRKVPSTTTSRTIAVPTMTGRPRGPQIPRDLPLRHAVRDLPPDQRPVLQRDHLSTVRCGLGFNRRFGPLLFRRRQSILGRHPVATAAGSSSRSSAAPCSAVGSQPNRGSSPRCARESLSSRAWTAGASTWPSASVRAHRHELLVVAGSGAVARRRAMAGTIPTAARSGAVLRRRSAVAHGHLHDVVATDALRPSRPGRRRVKIVVVN